MSESERIVGTCQQIERKPGSEWVAFHINIGKQYPVKLSTKKSEVIAAAEAIGDALATWDFGAVESDKINEHTGKPYVNRYLNAVTAGDVTGAEPQTASIPPNVPAAPQSAAPAQTGTHPAPSAGDKDRSIIRQTCLKVAAQVYAGKGTGQKPDADGLLPSDPIVGDVIAAAARFEIWVTRDLNDIPF